MMKRIKAKVIGKGTCEDPYRVNLPTYIMIGDIAKDKTVLVDVPADEVDEKGKLNEKLIREKYPQNWSKFNAKDVELKEVKP